MRPKLVRKLSVVFSFSAIGAACATSPVPQPAPGPTVQVVELTAERIAADYAAERYTAVDLTLAFLDRIGRYEDRYNAFISMNPEALSIAEDLDLEYLRVGPRGPMHGVPVVVKDNIDYGGLVTTAGYSGFQSAAGGIDMVPDDDAATVNRLREAGAIILGKTNLPDFAGDGTRTRSSVAGVTLNAYDVTRAPGGSSGGTATAVNASFAVLGLGTETGGSIQNPAAAQGLVGVKPTYGLVPLEGVVPIDGTYRDVVGPIARSVHDAAMALDVLAGPTAEDLATFAAVGHIPDEGYLAALSTTALRGKRFGLVGMGWRESWLPLEPETEALYRDAIEALRSRGAEVVEDPFADTGWRELYEERSRRSRAGRSATARTSEAQRRRRTQEPAGKEPRRRLPAQEEKALRGAGGATQVSRRGRAQRRRAMHSRPGARTCGSSSARYWRTTCSTGCSFRRPVHRFETSSRTPTVPITVPTTTPSSPATSSTTSACRW